MLSAVVRTAAKLLGVVRVGGSFASPALSAYQDVRALWVVRTALNSPAAVATMVDDLTRVGRADFPQ